MADNVLLITARIPLSLHHERGTKMGREVSLLIVIAVVYGICAQRLCPRLQKPWNGQVIGSCDRFQGAQCLFECREPYILVGSKVRVCGADGTWSGTTTACELDACPDCGSSGSNCVSLYNPENGLVEGQCKPGIPGKECVFHCFNGYALEGESTLRCQNNGYWSTSPPACTRTSAAICEDIVISNGFSSCTQTNGGLTVCSITCEESFMLVGTSVLTCSPSGEWSDQIPGCTRTDIEASSRCPTLIAPDGGRLVGSCTEATTGDTCQLVCLSGTRPTDLRILICQSTGRWSNTLPRCVNDGCPSISVPQGSASGSCSPGEPGQTCTITCDNGYVLTGGSGVLVCQPSGEWSAATPTCTVQSCPVLPAPVSGSTSGTCSPGQVEQTCNFYCNVGFTLVGQATLVCGSDGRWSANPPYCTEETCPPLNAPAEGTYSGACTGAATAGQSCSFSCPGGYTLAGQPTLYCGTGGKWSANPPTCTRLTCPPLTATPNTIISGSCSQAAIGEICTFTCVSGHTLVGQNNLYCQDDGSWSSATPACSRLTCPPLPASSNMIVSGSCSQAAVGEICTFTCASGYTLVGQTSLYCQESGRWSSEAPTCTRPPATRCTNLYAPANGFILGTCAPGQVGQTCAFGCYAGYVLVGQQALTCLANGQWSSNSPQCNSSSPVERGSCPILYPPPNGEFLECDNRPGGQCTIVCEKGYARSGSRVRTCLTQGTWSGYAPTCTKTVGYTTTTYTYKVVPLWTLVFG